MIAPAPDAERPLVLLVDDEPHVRSALRRSLRRCPFELVLAGSGEEALRLLAELPVDVVVSDQLMPGMTGLELLSRVRDQQPYTVRVMLTGHADVETALAAVREGRIWRFLTKPWDDQELKATLHLACEKRGAERGSRDLLRALGPEDEDLPARP